jgi:predicted dinucleotide-utilizing enzyme
MQIILKIPSLNRIKHPKQKPNSEKSESPIYKRRIRGTQYNDMLDLVIESASPQAVMDAVPHILEREKGVIV